MKPILKFLVRLYPSEWHKRYGTEFDALLEDGTPRARDVFDVFWGLLKCKSQDLLLSKSRSHVRWLEYSW
jgi:hypothetical protein